jgi:hypothetical protein
MSAGGMDARLAFLIRVSKRPLPFSITVVVRVLSRRLQNATLERVGKGAACFGGDARVRADLGVVREPENTIVY